MDKSITFVTGNSNKAEQLGKYLNAPVTNKKLDLMEIQSLDLSEVVREKVKSAFNDIRTPVIVDDVDLTILKMGKLPGPFVKYFISEMGLEGICRMVDTLSDRSAIARVAIGFFDGAEVKVFIGEILGKIAEKPLGQGGFGWDQIFIPDGYLQTRAEMDEQDYDITSPRKLALEKFKAFFDEWIKITQ